MSYFLLLTAYLAPLTFFLLPASQNSLLIALCLLLTTFLLLEHARSRLGSVGGRCGERDTAHHHPRAGSDWYVVGGE